MKWRALPWRSALSSAAYKKLFRNYFLRLFALFVVLLVAGTVLLTAQLQQQNERHLQQTADSLSHLSENIFAQCQKVTMNVNHIASLSELVLISRNRGISETDSPLMFNVQRNLASYKAFNRYIDSISVYLKDGRFIFSDNGTITFDSFCQTVFDIDSSQIFSIFPVSKTESTFVPRGSVSKEKFPTRSVYVLPLISSSGAWLGNLLVFLNEEQLARQYEELLDDGMEYAVFSKDGTRILPFDAPRMGAEGQNSHWETARGQNSGWVSCVAYSDTFMQRQWTLGFLIFLTTVFLGIALLLVATNALCKKTYAPLRELSDMVSETKSEIWIDYDILKRAIAEMLENKVLLEKQMQLYQPVLVNSFLLQLLNPQGQDIKNTLAMLEHLKCRMPYPLFLCAAVTTENSFSGFQDGVLTEETGKRAGLVYAHYQKDIGIFLLNGADENAVEQAMEELVARLRQEQAVRLCGIGELVGAPKDISVSCAQALKALSYLPVDFASKTVEFSMLVENQLLDKPPSEALKNLRIMFSAQRFDTAKTMLLQFFSDSVRSGVAAKAHLRHAQKQLAEAAQAWQDMPECRKVGRYCFQNPEEMDDFAHACLALCDRCAECVQSSLERSSREILEWLDLHCRDAAFSLSAFAETFGLSESSMSRKIKQLTGESFLHYVHQKRIQYACTLLRTEKLPVAQIARTVGYDSELTFRRSFKKYIGVTPNDYRAPNRQDSDRGGASRES